jgi:hypothetical protein
MAVATTILLTTAAKTLVQPQPTLIPNRKKASFRQVAERGTRPGKKLVRRVLERATADGLTSIALLPWWSAGYFPRFGFRRVMRQEVPHAVPESIEFKSACPASAVVMELLPPA